MNLNHKHYGQIVQRHIHLGPALSHRGSGNCCGWNWMEVIQNLRLPNPETERISESDSAPLVVSMCSETIPPGEHHAGTFLALHCPGIWFDGGGSPAPQALSVSSLYLERFPLLHGKARLLLFTQQSSWSDCWNKNKSVYEKPAGEGICSVNEDIIFCPAQ